MIWTSDDPSGPAGAGMAMADALIKLWVMVNDAFGASGRAIMAALIAGERDPVVLTNLARGSLRSEDLPA